MQFYFDENISFRIPRGLAELLGNREDLELFATVDVTDLGKSASDSAIVQYVGGKQGILVTQDGDFRRQRAIRDLLKDYPIGVILLKMPKSSTNHWQMVKLVVNEWEEIVKTAQAQKPPFWCRVSIRAGVEVLAP